MTNIIELFKNFKLKIQIECLECDMKKLISLKVGDFFNLEDNYIATDIKEGFFCHRLCSGCKNFIFVDIKKLFEPDFIRKIYDGIKNFEE